MHITVNANVPAYGLSADELRREVTGELARLARENGVSLDSLSVVVGPSEESVTLSTPPKRRGFLARLFG